MNILATRRVGLKKIFLAFFSIALVLFGFLAIDAYIKRPQKTEIITSEKSTISAEGHLRSSHGASSQISSKPQIVAKAHTAVEYESQPIDLKGRPNAAILEWDQSSDKGVSIEVRTHNGLTWSPWVPTDSVDGGRDGTETDTKSSAFVLANNIDSAQFRVSLAGDSEKSATVDLASVTIQSINSKKGPNGHQSKPLYKSLLGVVKGEQASAAINNGPSIISRADWGSPSPDYSEWTPEYEPLKRAIVHHTATTEPSDTYATVRAIWQYHAKSLGWGDIGYNYLVDYSGKIFEGRLFDHDYAAKNRVDVVAGHAYDNNRGTTGISAIGTYSVIQPTGAMLDSISNIIAYKFAPYSLDPRGDTGFGPGTGGAIIGHREVTQTSCPGNIMFSQIQRIKDVAHEPYVSYNKQYLYDYQHINSILLKDGTPITPNSPLLPTDNVKVKMYLKNNGGSTWSNMQSHVTLGTNNPKNRSGNFRHTSWPAANRMSSFSKKLNGANSEVASNVVHPGEVGVFEFPINIPTIVRTNDTTPVTISESIQPVIDGVSWFPHDIGMHFSINVRPVVYDYSVESQGIYTDEALTTKAKPQLQPDTDYYLTLALRNTGTAQWNRNVMHLGTTSPNDRRSILANSSWIGSNRLPPMDESMVEPGEVAHFKTKIRTPTSLHTNLSHREYVTPVADGIAWLRDIGIYWNIEVPRADYQWQIMSQDLYSDTSRTLSVAGQKLTRGNPYYARLVIKNTGNTTWYKNSFNLGTTSPNNRESAFRDISTWQSPNRPATLKEDSVKPGETGTIESTFSTNQSSRDTREYFTPVIEHLTWLVDYGLYWELSFN